MSLNFSHAQLFVKKLFLNEWLCCPVPEVISYYKFMLNYLFNKYISSSKPL